MTSLRKIESPEIDLHIYGQLTFGKGTSGKERHCADTMGIHVEKHEKYPVPQTEFKT